MARFLVLEILTSRLGRSRKNNLLRLRIPVDNDGRIILALLDDGGPLLAALLPLGLGTLGRYPRALLATRVLALVALLAETKRSVADMALPVYTHSDGLLYAEDIALAQVPFAWLQL